MRDDRVSRQGRALGKHVVAIAKGRLIGRAWVYALAALGAAGVRRMLQTIREEIEVAMALAGVTSVSVIDRTLLV